MGLQIGCCAAVVVMSLALAVDALAAGVDGVVIDTDRSVNCASLETIVADVTRGCKRDQERAVAIYDFMIRMMWMHYDYDLPKEMEKGRMRSVTDPLKVLNVYGIGGCGMQSVVFSTLLKAAGLESRQVAPGFAHISNEVRWGGKWHWMDVWLPLYLLDEKGEIYSYDELMANRGLITKAVKEGRHSPNFMYNPGPDTRAMLGAKPHRALGSGAREVNYVENLRLRPGERVTWLWDNVGKWYFPGEKFVFPAFKFPADKNAKRAFPYWEPYRKDLAGGPHPWSKVYYRYYGNAIFEHRVPLTKGRLATWGAKLTNVANVEGGPDEPRANVLVVGVGCRDATAPAVIEIPFDLPYVIADSEIECDAEPAAGGKVTFEYSLDSGKTWKLAASGGEPGKPARKFSIGRPNARKYPAGTTSGQYAYRLRITLGPGKGVGAIKRLTVTNATMLNFYSRPQLEVGKNVVTVTAAAGSPLDKTPLEITCARLEDWKDEKSFTHKVACSGQTCVIQAGGTKRPKMKSITIHCPLR